jgi:hypothetical protein
MESKQKRALVKKAMEMKGMMKFTHYLGTSTFVNSRIEESSTCKCS